MNFSNVIQQFSKLIDRRTAIVSGNIESFRGFTCLTLYTHTHAGLKIEGILLIRKKLRAPTRCNEGRALKGVWFPIVRPWTHPRRTPVPRPFHRTQSSKCPLSLSLSLLSNPRETFWNPIQPSRFDHGWGRTRFVGPDQRGISTLGESFDPSKGNFCLAGCRIFFLFSDFFFFLIFSYLEFRLGDRWTIF